MHCVPVTALSCKPLNSATPLDVVAVTVEPVKQVEPFADAVIFVAV